MAFPSHFIRMRSPDEVYFGRAADNGHEQSTLVMVNMSRSRAMLCVLHVLNTAIIRGNVIIESIDRPEIMMDA
jgi:hypothetical protein